MADIRVKPSKSALVRAGLVAVVVGSLGANAALGYQVYIQSQELKAYKNDPSAEAQKELTEVIAEVNKLIALPTDVTPVLATVSDAASLKERNAFFAPAENGDKVLMYVTAADVNQRKAYLYRPSTKQLINVAPVAATNNQVQPQQDQFSMEIRNGTPNDGLEERMKALLARVFPNATVPSSGVAVRSTYESSVLVKVDGSDELAEKLSTLFNVEVVALPAGEPAPSGVDFLLILGGQASATPAASEASPSANQ